MNAEADKSVHFEDLTSEQIAAFLEWAESEQSNVEDTVGLQLDVDGERWGIAVSRLDAEAGGEGQP